VGDPMTEKSSDLVAASVVFVKAMHEIKQLVSKS
jgi:hypothetical protein